MMALGAARDNAGFADSLAAGKRPKATAIVYEGVFNEHRFPASKTERLSEPFGHAGTDRHGKPYLGIECVSVKDGQPRDPSVPLDLIACVDVSGSMGSSLEYVEGREDGVTKLEAAKKSVRETAEKMEVGDSIALTAFANEGTRLLSPTLIGDLCDSKAEGEGDEKKSMSMKALDDAVEELKLGGGTCISAGLETALQVAREAKEKFKNEERAKAQRVVRIALFTDMHDNEVQSGLAELQRLSVEGAAEGIHLSYIGIGSDFQQELTEQISISMGCNYFGIRNTKDYSERISAELASAFFPVVKFLRLSVTGQLKVKRIVGAGKGEKKEEREEGGGMDAWDAGAASLRMRTPAARLAREALKKTLPLPVVALVLDEAHGKLTETVFEETSVFPSPVSAGTEFTEGGWVLVELESPAEGAMGQEGEAKEGMEVKMVSEFVTLEDQIETQTKEVNIAQALRSGADFSSSEGMAKAMALMQYVDEVKRVLSASADTAEARLDSDFLAWFKQKAAQLGLEKEEKALNDLLKLEGAGKLEK